MANKYPPGSPDTWTDDDLRLQLDQIEEARRNGTLSPSDEQIEEAIYKTMASRQFNAPPVSPQTSPPPPVTGNVTPPPNATPSPNPGSGQPQSGTTGNAPQATSPNTVPSWQSTLPPVTAPHIPTNSNWGPFGGKNPPPPVSPSPSPPPAGKEKQSQGWQYDNSVNLRVPNLLPEFQPGGGIGKGLGAQGSSITAGGIGDSIGGAVELAGRLGVPYAKEIGEVIQAFSAVPDAIKGFIKGLHGANMEFAEFSSTMADVLAVQQGREIELAQERGDRRAGTASELAESMHNMNVEFAKGEDRLANAMNKFGAGIADMMTEIIRLLNALLPEEKGQEKDIGGGVTMKEQLQLAQASIDLAKFGRPDRF